MAKSQLLEEPRWLLLIHQIPPKPDYFRVKIWRRLQRVGALAIKNSVYVLPVGDRTQEDLQWIVREIVDGGGDASLCEARFVDGLSDGQIEAMFHAARDAEYESVASQARRLVDDLARADEERAAEIAADADRLRRRLADIVLIDLLGAPGREAAEAAVEALDRRLRPDPGPEPAPPAARESYRGRVWVTRKGVHVDRMASVWLIRRFIDERAEFKLVPAKGYRPEPGEVRFDMFDAEFTHAGSSCTFEVLLDRFALRRDPGLVAVAEVVHELDVRDGRFPRDEVAGIGAMIAGISLAHREDEARLETSARLFDSLYEHFRRRRR